MKLLISKTAAAGAVTLTVMAFLASAPGASAQDKYPSRAIHLIVPFNAGGASDIVARVIGNAISEKVGQSVVVENRPGATGMIGSLAVSRADPDGYTLLMAVISSHAVSPAMKKVPPFDPIKDFTPIVRVGNSVHTLITRTSLPVTDTKSLIDYIKSNPGKVTYGSSGLASFPYLGGKLMERAAGIEMVHVPFSGDGPAVTALISQTVDILFTPSARAYVDAKSVKLIGDASSKRLASRPDWPTLIETGLPGFTLVSWVGLMAPPNTPRAIVDLINKTVNEALKEPTIEIRLEQIGYTVAGGTPDEFSDAVRDEVARIRALNIQLD
jgi:tripartite-type tricarboxylate transporter receptor subunit TctC